MTNQSVKGLRVLFFLPNPSHWPSQHVDTAIQTIDATDTQQNMSREALHSKSLCYLGVKRRIFPAHNLGLTFLTSDNGSVVSCSSSRKEETNFLSQPPQKQLFSLETKDKRPQKTAAVDLDITWAAATPKMLLRHLMKSAQFLISLSSTHLGAD